MRLTAVSLELLRTMPIEEPTGGTDKDARGRVLLIGGSALSPGALALAGEAALRSGAGKLLVGVPRQLSASLGMHHPEFGILALAQTDAGEPDARGFDEIKKSFEHCDALLIGPGMTDEDNAHSLARQALAATDKPIILDAAAITGFRNDRPALKAARSAPILTPHAGELAALTGAARERIEQDPATAANQAAQDFGAFVVLKGAETFIACPQGKIWRHSGGVPGLATAGSGDVLAGLLAGLVARGVAPIPACLWSVYIHARAGQELSTTLGRLGFLARELPGLFPRLIERDNAHDGQ